MNITLIIIAITCIVSFAGFSNENLIRQLIFWPPALTRDREYYRLVTYGFIHASPQHLLFNMFTLYFFGTFMERFYANELGMLTFPLFYAGALIVSILPTYFEHRDNPQYRSLGASGAVSAALFAFILVKPWAQIIIYVIPVPAIIYAALYVAYSFYMDRRQSDNVNHSAHLWGALYGVVFTILIEPQRIEMFWDSLVHPGVRQ